MTTYLRAIILVSGLINNDLIGFEINNTEGDFFQSLELSGEGEIELSFTNEVSVYLIR